MKSIFYRVQYVKFIQNATFCENRMPKALVQYVAKLSSLLFNSLVILIVKYSLKFYTVALACAICYNFPQCQIQYLSGYEMEFCSL